VPLLALRLAAPDLLIDLRRIEGLDMIASSNGRVVVGAMATQHAAEVSRLLAERCPLVPDALHHVAHPQIRSRGTVGGSVAHADPAAELPAVVTALGATIRVTGPSGERVIAAADLYTTTLTSTIADDEILTAVEFPAAPAGSGTACVEIARRSGDYAMCGGVAQVTVEDGSFADVRLVLFGLATTPARLSGLEDRLRGGDATAEAIGAVAPAAAEGIELTHDDRVSDDYRRQLASVVTRRALAKALERSTGTAGTGSHCLRPRCW
jgi:carbon-monoxide dehydrogenase medium subunit